MTSIDPGIDIRRTRFLPIEPPREERGTHQYSDRQDDRPHDKHDQHVGNVRRFSLAGYDERRGRRCPPAQRVALAADDHVVRPHHERVHRPVIGQDGAFLATTTGRTARDTVTGSSASTAAAYRSPASWAGRRRSSQYSVASKLSTNRGSPPTDVTEPAARSRCTPNYTPGT